MRSIIADDVISKYYYDPRFGLVSVDGLFRKIKKEEIGVRITRKQISEFIQKQETHQIHKELKEKQNSFIPRHPNH